MTSPDDNKQLPSQLNCDKDVEKATDSNRPTARKKRALDELDDSSREDSAAALSSPSSSSDPGNNSQQQPQPRRQRRARKAPHELLTEAEKKANHIASEQKRRQNIRLGFEQLIEVVPSLSQGNRSEALILQKSVDHIRHLISVKDDLKDQVRDLQGLLGEPVYEEDSSEDELAYAALG
ncbi:hypothetical protein BDB00DRAFT_855815 [Zychaea mexicana]|uniref:uncharacterized protein n=1 Tax=Zychaea mexicana TaxID=64656 RepID=UPI0022FDD984|nr:uncharacterized protein BDB00DRAFT_855815 [Zychaea mexicana]KAI9484412.1 hypothetical protein BDB00DRAFT_855815 [Zychaea mexicana]